MLRIEDWWPHICALLLRIIFRLLILWGLRYFFKRAVLLPGINPFKGGVSKQPFLYAARLIKLTITL
jgi:hypothetical protein